MSPYLWVLTCAECFVCIVIIFIHLWKIFMSSIIDMATQRDPEFVITSSIVVILQMLDNRYTFCHLWCSRVVYTQTCSKSSLFSEDSFQVYPYVGVLFLCLAVVDCRCLYISDVTFVTSFMEIGCLGSWHTDLCLCVTSSHSEVIERREYINVPETSVWNSGPLSARYGNFGVFYSPFLPATKQESENKLLRMLIDTQINRTMLEISAEEYSGA
jgi:hypothetical protein